MGAGCRENTPSRPAATAAMLAVAITVVDGCVDAMSGGCGGGSTRRAVGGLGAGDMKGVTRSREEYRAS